MQTPASLITDRAVTVLLGNKVLTATSDHANFKAILTALSEQRYDALEALFELDYEIKQWASEVPGFTLEHGIVKFEGDAYSETISNKVTRMIRSKLSPTPLLNFLRKLRENPSATAQNELLLFCEANKFLIHEDGDIVAYKAVREDYFDIHSGRYLNKVGAVIEMPRYKVDDNRDQTCSFGLHFAALDYAQMFGGHTARLMVLKLNPRDVVSIPSDYNNQKGRCCRYEVFAELDRGSSGLPEQETYSSRDIANASVNAKASVTSRVLAIIRETLGITLEDNGADLDETFDALKLEYYGGYSRLAAMEDALATEFDDYEARSRGRKATPRDVLNDVLDAVYPQGERVLEEEDFEDEDEEEDDEADRQTLRLRVIKVIADIGSLDADYNTHSDFDTLDFARSDRESLRARIQDTFGVDTDDIQAHETPEDVIDIVVENRF